MRGEAGNMDNKISRGEYEWNSVALDEEGGWEALLGGRIRLGCDWSPDRLRKLLEPLLEASTGYDEPIVIEWTKADSDVYVLQVRPVQSI